MIHYDTVASEQLRGNPLIFDVTMPEFYETALCAQTDPELFFPERGGSTRQAKQVCMVCESREECLEWALDNKERYGLWGGVSERERRKIITDRMRAERREAAA